MPLVTGTILDGAGDPLVTQIRFWGPHHVQPISAAAVPSKSVVFKQTDPEGNFSQALAGGEWVLTWPVGAQINRVNLVVPPSGGPYEWGPLMFLKTQSGGSSGAGDAAPTWFDDVAQMLQTPAGTWINGVTKNSYGETPSNITGWQHLVKTDSAAAGISENGDSILETDDGLGFAIRKWIAS